MLYAQIIPLVHLDRDRLLDYSVLAAMLPSLTVGSLVEVPLKGRLKKGVVAALKRHSPVKRILPIKRLLEAQAVDDSVIDLAKFLQQYYGAQLGPCLKIILPW